MNNPLTVIGIETSCDETGIAVVRASLEKERPSFDILSNVVASQIDVHSTFGGVVPNLAAREHATNLPIVLEQALKKADVSPSTIAQGNRDDTIIAVATQPGLIPCLLVGTHFARTLSWRWDLPVIGVDHMEGHLYSPLIEIEKSEAQGAKNLFPAVALIVSGGHTMLVLVRNIGDHTLLGETVDDAAGEAFDKVARMLGLGYPGGPAVSVAAEKGSSSAFDFPRPMLDSDDYRFSFSGLKTAVLYTLRDLQSAKRKEKRDDMFDLPDDLVADVAASFQQAVVETLVTKTMRAADEHNAASVWLSGGVAANKRLRRELQNANATAQRDVLVPSMQLSTDNGVMIAAAGALKWLLTDPSGDWRDLNAHTLHRLEPWTTTR